MSLSANFLFLYISSLTGGKQFADGQQAAQPAKEHLTESGQRWNLKDAGARLSRTLYMIKNSKSDALKIGIIIFLNLFALLKTFVLNVFDKTYI